MHCVIFQRLFNLEGNEFAAENDVVGGAHVGAAAAETLATKVRVYGHN